MKIVRMKFKAVDWMEYVPYAMYNTSVDLITKRCYAC